MFKYMLLVLGFLALFVLGCNTTQYNNPKKGDTYDARSFVNYIKPAECADLAHEFRNAVDSDFDWQFEKIESLETALDFLGQKLIYEFEVRDHWQTPSETIARGAGDCEDLIILAFSFLRAIGYPHKLYMVYGWSDVLTGHVWGTSRYPGYLEVAIDGKYLVLPYEVNNLHQYLSIYRGAVHGIVEIP